MYSFTKEKKKYYDKLESNSAINSAILENILKEGIRTNGKIKGKAVKEIIMPKNDFELELSNALYKYFSEIYFLTEKKEIIIKIDNIKDNSIINLYFKIFNKLKSNEPINNEDYRNIDLSDRARLIYDSLLLSKDLLLRTTDGAYVYTDIASYLYHECCSYSYEWNFFMRYFNKVQDIVEKIVENCEELDLSNYELQKKAIVFMNEFHNLYEKNEVKLTEYHRLYEQKNLRSWPYHTNRISKEIEETILKNGLLKDEEYCVYVNPKYGAFFYNTKCKTIEEEIISCKEMPPIMNYHVYVPQDVLLAYIDKGYEFAIGPRVIFENDKDVLNGIYCTNYSKKFKRNTK